MKKVASAVIAGLLLFLNAICFALEVADEHAMIEIYSNEPGVYFIITDPLGRRAGYDAATRKSIEEFPSTFEFGIDSIDSISEKYHGGATINLVPGTYTIEIIGTGLTTFDVDISVSRRVTRDGFTNFFTGAIDKGQTSTYQFTYTSDPTKPAGTATKVVTSSNLKQDITLSRKMDWIDNDGVTNSLIKKVEAIEASILKGNKTAAKNQINAFINEVKAQACEPNSYGECPEGKHIAGKLTHDTPAYDAGGKVVKQAGEVEFLYAVKLLIEDAQYLLKTLK